MHMFWNGRLRVLLSAVARLAKRRCVMTVGRCGGGGCGIPIVGTKEPFVDGWERAGGAVLRGSSSSVVCQIVAHQLVGWVR